MEKLIRNIVDDSFIEELCKRDGLAEIFIRQIGRSMAVQVFQEAVELWRECERRTCPDCGLYLRLELTGKCSACSDAMIAAEGAA